MIDIRFIQSMLARNKQIIAALEIEVRSDQFDGFKRAVKYNKAQIAKLAAIQVALKAEISRHKWLACKKRSKKHGTMDANGNMHPAYKAFIENCKP